MVVGQSVLVYHILCFHSCAGVPGFGFFSCLFLVAELLCNYCFSYMKGFELCSLYLWGLNPMSSLEVNGTSLSLLGLWFRYLWHVTYAFVVPSSYFAYLSCYNVVFWMATPHSLLFGLFWCFTYLCCSNAFWVHLKSYTLVLLLTIRGWLFSCWCLLVWALQRKNYWGTKLNFHWCRTSWVHWSNLSSSWSYLINSWYAIVLLSSPFVSDHRF
jgi:hypothetical protein